MHGVRATRGGVEPREAVLCVAGCDDEAEACVEALREARNNFHYLS